MLLEDIDISLDIGEINQLIQAESRAPAKCTKSEYENQTYTDDDSGITTISTYWVLEWQRLDREQNFPFRSSHKMPEKGKPVVNRRGRTYVMQAEAFASLGIQGKTPSDFLGVEAWIEEKTEHYNINGRDIAKTWWKPIQRYVPGESLEGDSLEETTGLDQPEDSVSDIGIPEMPTEVSQPTSEDSDGSHVLVLDLIDGKGHRAAVQAIINAPDLSEETRNAATSGALFELLESQGKAKEDENGVWHKV